MSRRDWRTEVIETIEGWPEVRSDGIANTVHRKIFEKRRKAFLALKDRKTSLAEIAKTYDLGRQKVRKLALKALKRHRDGDLWGFRALLWQSKTKAYERRELPAAKKGRKSGDAGAFQALLRTHDTLPAFIEANLFKRSEAGQLQRRKSIRRFHRLFKNELERLKITKKQYPLNRTDKGLRSLYAYVRRVEEEDVAGTLARAGMGELAELYARRLANLKGTRPVLPFELVEADGHELKLDVYFEVERPDGKKERVDVPRIWIVALLEVYSGAVLGYSVSWYENYNTHDVLAAIASALYGRPPEEPLRKIPNSRYPGRSLPGELIPELKGVCWDIMSFDNHLAHKAKDVKGQVTRIVNASLCRGPSYVPEFRKFVEHGFKTLRESLGLSELKASRRRSAGKKNAKRSLRDAVHLDRVLLLLDGLIWEYNTEFRSEATLGRTALDALQDALNDPLIRRVSADRWGRPEFMTRRILKAVRGDPKRGRPLHINFEGGRYRGPALDSNPGLTGEQLIFEYDEDNIEQAKIFRSNGSELGVLRVTERWAGRPHSLRLRRHINALIAARKIVPAPGLDFVTAWERYYMETEESLPSRSKAAWSERRASTVKVSDSAEETSTVLSDSAPTLATDFVRVPKKRKVIVR